MRIKKINLENFKCFENIELDCSKITLLTGANSSGKSSVLNSLLGALQTARYPLFYSPNGDYVNMGDYSEVAFNHVRKQEIHIAFEFEQPDGKPVSVDTRFCENPKTRQPKLKSLQFGSPQFKLSLQAVNSHYEGSYSYTPTAFGADVGATKQMQAIMTKFFSDLDSVARKSSVGSKKAKRAPTDVAKLFFEPSEGKVKLSAQFEASAQEERQVVVNSQIAGATNMFSAMNQQFNYISSFRHPPERTYYRKTKGTLKVGRYGENHIDQLIEWEQSRSKHFRMLVKALQGLKLLNEIHTKTFPGGRFDIKVKPSLASAATSLIDVGFGVSQFLPIVVADLQLAKGTTIAPSIPG